MTRFNHLNVPPHWKHYWSKYPEGYTILEALLNWVNQVDEMVDNVNQWNIRLDQFFEDFEKNLTESVKKVLEEWKENGMFDEILAHILDLQISYDKTVTVGMNGDYQTLNEAVTFLSGSIPTHQQPWINVNIHLLADYVMREQLLVNGLNLGWIDITSESPEVVVDRQYITIVDPDYAYSSKSVFLGIKGAVLPSIKTLFHINETGTMDGIRMFSVRANSSLYIHAFCGAKGKADRLLVVSHGSRVTARFSVLKDSGNLNVRSSSNGIFAGEYGDYSGAAITNVAVDTSQAVVVGADMTNSGFDGLRITAGPGMVSAASSDVSNCGRYGIHIWRGGDMNFELGKANDCGTHGVFLDEGGHIAAQGAEISRSGNDNIYIRGTGTMDFNKGTTEYGGRFNAYLEQGATLNIQNGKARYATATGLYVTKASTVNAQATDITGNTSGAIFCETGSTVNAEQALCRTGTTDSSNDMIIRGGGIINARGAVGGTILSPNILHSHGIIFKHEVV